MSGVTGAGTTSGGALATGAQGIPNAGVPMVNQDNTVAFPWYRFFVSLFNTVLASTTSSGAAAGNPSNLTLASLQAEIDALQKQVGDSGGGQSVRAGTVEVDGLGQFSLTFDPPFATDVAQIWVGFPPGQGEPTSAFPANPTTFTSITNFSKSGANGLLLLSTVFTPVPGGMRWWAIGY